jgi:hypothetical protein
MELVRKLKFPNNSIILNRTKLWVKFSLRGYVVLIRYYIRVLGRSPFAFLTALKLPRESGFLGIKPLSTNKWREAYFIVYKKIYIGLNRKNLPGL